MKADASIPVGMKEVSKEEFFQALYTDTRDIMPNHNFPTFTTWEISPRKVWGWSYPGWRNVGENQRWAIAIDK